LREQAAVTYLLSQPSSSTTIDQSCDARFLHAQRPAHKVLLPACHARLFVLSLINSTLRNAAGTDRLLVAPVNL